MKRSTIAPYWRARLSDATKGDQHGWCECCVNIWPQNSRKSWSHGLRFGTSSSVGKLFITTESHQASEKSAPWPCPDSLIAVSIQPRPLFGHMYRPRCFMKEKRSSSHLCSPSSTTADVDAAAADETSLIPSDGDADGDCEAAAVLSSSDFIVVPFEGPRATFHAIGWTGALTEDDDADDDDDDA